MNESITNAKLEADEQLWYAYPGVHPLPNGDSPLFASFNVKDDCFTIIVGRDDGNYNKQVANACLERLTKSVDDPVHEDVYVYATPDITVEEAIATGNQMLQYFKDKYAADDIAFDENDFMKNFKVTRYYL